MRKILLSAPLLLAACTSSYEGIRLPSNANYKGLADKQSVGVPFTLTKPEFTIKKIDGSDPERYDISVAYVPDPNQRYALRIKPTWFSKIDFNLALGPGGGLTSSSADITDQAIPFATAVIKLAASVAPVLLAPAARPAGTRACLGQSGLAAVAKCAIQESQTRKACSQADGDEIKARLDRALLTDKDDKGPALDTIFARTDGEKKCFADAAADLTIALNGETADLTTALSNAEGAAIPTVAPVTPAPGVANAGEMQQIAAAPALTPTATLLAQADAIITEAAKNGDVSKAKKLIYATDLAVKGTPSYLKSFLSLGQDPSTGDAAILWKVLVDTKLAAGRGADPIQAIATGNKVQKAFSSIATMTAGQWRARYIPVLQFELAEAERTTLMATSAKDGAAAKEQASGLRRMLASMVNMSADYERLEKIDAILAEVPAFGVKDRQSRIAEYQGYVKEAAAIRTDLATRLSAATATEQGKTKDAVLPPSLPWVSQSCVTNSKVDGWIYTAGADAPDFVIVMRNASGTINPPRDTPEATPSASVSLPECGA